MLSKLSVVHAWRVLNTAKEQSLAMIEAGNARTATVSYMAESIKILKGGLIYNDRWVVERLPTWHLLVKVGLSFLRLAESWIQRMEPTRGNF